MSPRHFPSWLIRWETVAMERWAGHVGIYGREPELAVIRRFLDDVIGRPAALLIEGSAGIGKTTLWSAGIDLARQRGWWVLTCRPVQSEAPLSFSALGDLLGSVPEMALAELPRPQRQALDVALLRAEPGPDPPDQRAVAVAMLGVIRALAATAPVVVGVDDLPWLDRASAAVMEYALRRLTTESAGLLATVAPGDPTSAPPPVKWSLPREWLQSLEVGPLGLEALGAMLRHKTGPPGGWPEVVEVHEASGGNPFYALELAAALGAGGHRRDAGKPLPVPESLRPLVRRRLQALSPSGRDVALVAAAAACPTVELVLAACSNDHLARDGLESAEAAGVLQVTDNNVRFTHPLLRALSYSIATERERRRAHQCLAEATLASEERMRHLAFAAEGPDEQLASELAAAAQVAWLRGAAIAGAELADLALRLTSPHQSQARVQRLVDAGRLHSAAFDAEGARALLEAAADLSEPGQLRASALHHLAVVTASAEGIFASRPLLLRALGEAADGTLLKALVHRDLGFVMGLSTEGFTGPTLHQFRAAFGIAERIGDQALISQLTAFQAVAEFATGHGLRRDLIERALDGHHRGGRVAMASRAEGPRVLVSHLLRSSDDLAGARALLAEEYAEAAEQGAETDLPFVIQHLVELETWAGNIELAESYADHGYRVAQAAGAMTQIAFMHSARAIVRAYRGPLEEARAEAESAIDEGMRSGVYHPVLLGSHALGLAALVSGNPADAHARLAAITEATAGRGIIDPGWLALRTLPDDIEALIRLGDVEAADSLLVTLEERAHRLRRAWSQATSGRCRALLMSARGDHDAAAASMSEAFAAHERLEMPLELARTHLIAGDVARRARRKVAARNHMEQARTVFARLGATPWTERADAELARLGTSRGGGLDLTQADRQVANLVASGRTNREVAAELYMGLRTVEAHLSSVYRKLGIRSRSELARTWTERPDIP
jgi:DNA-binding CsgD family transcriptional regulator